MANPNIATMADMTLGKLKWTLTSGQPVIAQQSELTYWTTSNQSNNDRSVSMTVNDVSSYSDQADSMLVIVSANSKSGIEVPPTSSAQYYPRWTPSSTNVPETFVSHPNEDYHAANAASPQWSHFGENFDCYYLMNPTAGAGTLTVEYHGYEGGYGWYTYCAGGCFQIANTNGQANPFRLQPSQTGYRETGGGNYMQHDNSNYSGYYQDAYTPPRSNFTADANSFSGLDTLPGDFVFVSGRGGQHSGDRGDFTAGDGITMDNIWNANYSWHSECFFAYRSAIASRTDARTSGVNVSSSQDNWSNQYGFVVKGADPATLFTVTPPSATVNQVVKINQIVACNPEVATGMSLSLSLSGFPASPTDGSGDVLFTIPATTPVSTTTTPFKSGIVPTDNGTDCIDKPFYMTAGMSLNAAVAAPGATSSDFKSLDVIIDFEVIQS